MEHGNVSKILVLLAGVYLTLSGCATDSNFVWRAGSGTVPAFFKSSVAALAGTDWVRNYSGRHPGKTLTLAVFLVSSQSQAGGPVPYTQSYGAGPFTVEDQWYNHAVSTAHAIRWSLYDSFVQDLVDHGFRVVTVTRRHLLAYERLYAMQHARSADIPQPGHIREAQYIVVMKMNEHLPNYMSRHVASLPFEIQVINLQSNVIRYSATGSVKYVVQ
ncbi:MAG: hypothetical protein ACYCOU_15845 [Sulfobacillus sp.]